MFRLFTTVISGTAKFAIKILITVFTWSTIYFYGKIVPKMQLKITAISLLSVFWIVQLIRVPMPFVIDFIYGYLPEKVVRHKAFVTFDSISVFIIPLIVGGICYFFITARNRRRIELFFIKGFYYAFMFGITTLIMMLETLIITAFRYAKFHKVAYITAMANNEEHFTVANDIHKALEERGFKIRMTRTEALYRFPLSLLKHIFVFLLSADTSFNEYMLVGKDFKIFFHFSDIMLVGKEDTINNLYSILLDILAYEETYATLDRKAQVMEDQAHEIFRNKTSDSIEKLEECMNKVKILKLDYSEKEAIIRKILLLQNNLLMADYKTKNQAPPQQE